MSRARFAVSGGLRVLDTWLQPTADGQAQWLLADRVLGLLAELHVTAELLQSAGIGRTVNRLRKVPLPAKPEDAAKAENIRRAASELVESWKKAVGVAPPATTPAALAAVAAVAALQKQQHPAADAAR